jgi:membrane protease YdiL (CAAX protease family)
MIGVYVFLLWLGKVLTRSRSKLLRWGVYGMLAFSAGTILVLVAQIESQFADEEFFAALQVLVLAGFGVVLFIAQSFFERVEPVQTRRGLALTPAGLS